MSERRVTVIGYDAAELLDIACVTTTLENANLQGAGSRLPRAPRLFLEHLGRAPGRFVRQARTEAAAHLLVSTSLPMTGVAARCGFGTTETLRQAFVDRYGVPPSRYRSTATSATRPDTAPARP